MILSHVVLVRSGELLRGFFEEGGQNRWSSHRGFVNPMKCTFGPAPETVGFVASYCREPFLQPGMSSRPLIAMGVFACTELVVRSKERYLFSWNNISGVDEISNCQRWSPKLGTASLPLLDFKKPQHGGKATTEHILP